MKKLLIAICLILLFAGGSGEATINKTAEEVERASELDSLDTRLNEINESLIDLQNSL